MKIKLLLFFFLTTCLCCTPKLHTVITNRQAALDSLADFLVVEEDDTMEVKGLEIGEVRSGEDGFSTHCSYGEVINRLADVAIMNGGNILKITKHTFPDQWSSCHRITAKIFKVENPRIYERKIEWSSDRKLTWDDFKANVPADSLNDASAQTLCGFGFRTNVFTLFTKAKIFTTNTFYCRESWVREELKGNMELLKHEQTHFDLSQVYMRRLNKQLTETHLIPYTVQSVTAQFYKEVKRQYVQRQEQYDQETNHGQNRQVQEEWSAKIDLELAQ